MRTSTVVTLAALAVPALSVPVARTHIGIPARIHQATADVLPHGPHYSIDVREDATETDESGALKLGKIFKVAAGLASNFLKREDEELEAREPAAANIGKYLHLPHRFHLREEEESELEAREPAAANLAKYLHLPHRLLNLREDGGEPDESEALGLGLLIKTAAGLASHFLKREELEAREPAAANLAKYLHLPHRLLNLREDGSEPEESEALGLGLLIKTAAGLASHFLKREELEAREPAAANLAKYLHLPHRLLNLREEELVAREPAAANLAKYLHLPHRLLNLREDEAEFDESGAIKFGKLLKTAAGIASNFIREDELEMRYVFL